MASTFRYERSIQIAAPSARIAAEISNLRNHAHWSPFAAPDPRRRDVISGPAGVGQEIAFEGGRSGAGRLRVDAVEPGSIRMTLTMLKPMKAVNQVEFALTPACEGVRVSWIMSGPMTFLGRVMNLFVNCEAMCGRMFDQGLAALKAHVEAAPALSSDKEAV